MLITVGKQNVEREMCTQGHNVVVRRKLCHHNDFWVACLNIFAIIRCNKF